MFAAFSTLLANEYLCNSLTIDGVSAFGCATINVSLEHTQKKTGTINSRGNKVGCGTCVFCVKTSADTPPNG